MELFYKILAIVLMLPGLLSVIVPVMPGVPYMFVVALLYAILTRFSGLTGWEVVILGGIAALSIAIDFAGGLLGAKFGGASGKAGLWGFAGMLIGTVILPPFGGLVGLFAGILLGELRYGKELRAAGKAAGAGLIGSGAGMLVNGLVGIMFIIVFAYIS